MIMKKTIFVLVIMVATAITTNAMSYEQARNEALFLTDKMAYELNLTDAQYEAAYEINLDYLMGVTSVDDVFGIYWERRNLDLNCILYAWQWDAFCAATYFYRPLYWKTGYWHFSIYTRYPHRDYFYFGRPHFYATYRGGHAWHRNGGHSFYHGRDNHYRPVLSKNRTHFGMRNSFDRGDYRGSHAGSSTRVTSRQKTPHNSDGRASYNNHKNNTGNINHSSDSFNRTNSKSNFNRNSNKKGNVTGRSVGGGTANTHNNSVRSASSNNRGHIGVGRH